MALHCPNVVLLSMKAIINANQKLYISNLISNGNLNPQHPIYGPELGWSFLHVLARDGDLTLLRAILIWPNIEINPRDNDGWSPLDVAILNRQWETINFLRERGMISYHFDSL